MLCDIDVREGSIFFYWKQYLDSTMLRMIDLSCCALSMFEDIVFASTQRNTSTALYWK